MDKRAFFEKWYKRIWVEQDMSAIEQMTEPDVVAHGLTDAPQISQAAFRDFATTLLSQCTFNDVSIKHFMEDGDWAHMLLTFKGKLPKTYEPIVFDAQVLARVEGGKIVEAYNHPDYITLFQQLGTLPEDTIAQCLSGRIPK